MDVVCGKCPAVGSKDTSLLSGPSSSSVNTVCFIKAKADLAMDNWFIYDLVPPSR